MRMTKGEWSEKIGEDMDAAFRVVKSTCRTLRICIAMAIVMAYMVFLVATGRSLDVILYVDVAIVAMWVYGVLLCLTSLAEIRTVNQMAMRMNLQLIAALGPGYKDDDPLE